MNGKMSPGQRANLAARGYRGRGRAWNDVVAADPKTPEQLADWLSDPTKLRAALGDNPAEGLKRVITGYAAAQQAPGTEIYAQVESEVTKQLSTYLAENGLPKDDAKFDKVREGMKRLNLNPQDGSRGSFGFGQGAAYNKAAPGAAWDKEFSNLGELAQVEYQNAINPAIRDRAARIRNAYSSTLPSDGGFLIPEVLRSQLLQVALERAIVRPRATVIPMDSLRVPIPTVDATSNVSSVMGGLIAYWSEEGGTFTDASAKFGRVMLEAKKLTGYSGIPRELYQDSVIAMQAFIEANWPMALAWFEDLGFMKGTGAGEPLGFMNNPATIIAAAEAGQPTLTIVWENIVNMFSRMLPSSLSSAVWLASPDTFPQLATMALSVGTGGAPVWLSNGQAGPPMTILGRPLIITEKAQKLGTQGDLIFADLAYYLVGDRQMMTLDTSEHYLFGSDKVAVRIVQRVDGQPWIQSAITPQNNGPTLSPFVELATR